LLTNWREKLTTTWRSLNAELRTLDEARVLAMLTEERTNQRRVSVLQRLHQRYNTLRVSRERIELLQEAKQP
jgi:hypothetical protein